MYAIRSYYGIQRIKYRNGCASGLLRGALGNVGAQEAQKKPIGFTGKDAGPGVSMKALESVFRNNFV